jgi:hypothetical protein
VVVDGRRPTVIAVTTIVFAVSTAALTAVTAACLVLGGPILMRALHQQMLRHSATSAP